MSIYVNPDFLGVEEDFKKASQKPKQKISPERLEATRDEVRQKMVDFLIDLKSTSGLTNTKIGSSKEPLRITQKANEDYGGHKEYVGDWERCMGIGDTPLQILKGKSELQNPNSDVMRRHNAVLVSLNDQFADPKYKTGYRAINAKVGFPVGNPSDEEIHFVEIQITASQIEEVYDKTHEYLDIIRAVSDQAKDREMTKDEKRIQAYAFAGCRYENGIASRENGYDELLDPRYRSKYEVSKTTQNNMENQILALEELRNNFTPD